MNECEKLLGAIAGIESMIVAIESNREMAYDIPESRNAIIPSTLEMYKTIKTLAKKDFSEIIPMEEIRFSSINDIIKLVDKAIEKQDYLVLDTGLLRKYLYTVLIEEMEDSCNIPILTEYKK